MLKSEVRSFDTIADLREYLSVDLKDYFLYRLNQLGHSADLFQMIIADWLQGSIPEYVHRKKVLLGFRGCSKTTMLRWYVEWRWLRRPDTQIIVHSSTDHLAGEFTNSLMDTLKYDDLFEHVRPAPGQGTLQFTLGGQRLEKGNSIRCAGINTSVTGQRSNLYVFDDPEPDTQPQAMYNRIIAAFEEAENVMHPPDFQWRKEPYCGRIPDPEVTQYIVSGQPHWTGTAYLPPPPDPRTGDERSHPLRDAIFLKIPCLRTLPDGREVTMMPSRFKTVDLLRMRDEHIISPPRWRLQMMIDTSPVEGEGSVIPVSRLGRVHHDLTKVRELSAVIDPADSEEGCEWGIAIGGLIDNRIHVVDMYGIMSEIYSDDKGILAGEETWQRIFEQLELLNVRKIYIEKNMKSARTAAVRQLRRMNIKARVYEYAAAANKLTRIVESVDHPTNSGMLTFEPHVLDDTANWRQLAELRYTSLPKPCDRLDAMASLISVFIEMPHLMSTGKRATELRPVQDRRPASMRHLTPENPISRVVSDRRGGGAPRVPSR